jgi:hypothetical protein
MFDSKRLNNRPIISGSHAQARENMTMNHHRDGNFVDHEHYKTRIIIEDFASLPRFWINTSTFTFDSHGDTTGWVLDIRQSVYHYSCTKLSVVLRHGSYRDGEGLRIRFPRTAVTNRLQTPADVAKLFEGAFDIVHSGKLVAVQRDQAQAIREHTAPLRNALEHREAEIAALRKDNEDLTADLALHERMLACKAELEDFEDEALLAELNRRALARLGDYRGPRQVRQLADVIDFDEIQRRSFDDSRLSEVLGRDATAA